MADQRAQIILDGDVGPLRQKLREAAQHMQSFGNQAGASFGSAAGPLDALRGKFIALTALLAGGALFGKAIQETAAYANESIQLGKAMGQSAGDASVWVSVLADAGSSAEDFSGAARGLLKNLQADEKGLNDMGLATRDAGGKLRSMNDLMLDAIRLVNDHKEGTDRNVAARQIFGKSVDGSSNLLKINTETVNENKALMEDLGLVVGQNMVDNYKAYDDAMDKSELVIKAFKTTIGNALMPVLTKLGEWFVSVGPYAVVGIRGAIGGLTTVFWGLKNAVTIVWEVLNGLVFSIAEPLRALVSALYKVMTGDFAGAQKEMMEWPQRIGQAWGKAWDNVLASSTEARDKIEQLFLDGPPAAASPSGGRSANPDKDKDKKGKKEAVASFMQYYELALAEEKRLASERDALHEYSKEQELAYWRTLLAYAQLSADDRVAVQRKAAALEIEVRRKAAKDEQAVGEELARRMEALALGEVDARQAAARIALDQKQIDLDQMLRLELQFENDRYQIQRKALMDRIKLAAEDPNTSPAERERLNSKLMELDQQFNVKRMEALAKIGDNTKYDGYFAGFGDSVAGEFQKTLVAAQTWQQGMANIARETGMTFLSEVITKPLSAFVANQAKMLALKLGFLGQEQTAQAASSTVVASTKAGEATSVISANAAEAASGAAASQASIPYVGPVLAVAAMAAIFAAVMAMKGGLKSARGGYDIPSGSNPMTQLHEEEMVLPKQFANVIRGMAAGEGQGRRQAGPPIVLSGVSAGEFFIANRRELTKVLDSAWRDNAFRGVPT